MKIYSRHAFKYCNKVHCFVVSLHLYKMCTCIKRVQEFCYLGDTSRNLFVLCSFLRNSNFLLAFDNLSLQAPGGHTWKSYLASGTEVWKTLRDLPGECDWRGGRVDCCSN